MKWCLILGTAVACLGLIGCGPAETTEPPPVSNCPEPAQRMPSAADPANPDEYDTYKECAVYVSASLGDDENPGTREAPVASLAAAAALGLENYMPVYACGEIWTDPVVWPSPVSLYGGFDCEDGWTYKGASRRAAVETGPGQIPFTTVEPGGKILVTDVRIVAASAVEPSGSSIAVLVTEPHGLEFRRSILIAQNGAHGLDGEMPVGVGPAGVSGKSGEAACISWEGKGGDFTETICDVETLDYSIGGVGGTGGGAYLNGTSGLLAPAEKDPMNPQDGDGGKGETAMAACTAGEPGADGVDGENGAHVSQALGHLGLDGFTGIDGPDGAPGRAGQGGGGGGGSLGSSVLCPPGGYEGGAGGGGGGTAGCGGKGGKGGKAGGSSITVAVLGSGELWFESCELWVGMGGNGGDGAPGQSGGPGGAGGKGGAGSGMAAAGCAGGTGGTGGKGGSGAGGNAGHAFYIAYSGAGYGDTYPNTTYHGDKSQGVAGKGGPGAQNGIAGRSSSAVAPGMGAGFQQ